MLLFRAAPAARGRDCSGSAGAPATKTGLLADVLPASPGVYVHLGRFALRGALHAPLDRDLLGHRLSQRQVPARDQLAALRLGGRIVERRLEDLLQAGTLRLEERGLDGAGVAGGIVAGAALILRLHHPAALLGELDQGQRTRELAGILARPVGGALIEREILAFELAELPVGERHQHRDPQRLRLVRLVTLADAEPGLDQLVFLAGQAPLEDVHSLEHRLVRAVGLGRLVPRYALEPQRCESVVLLVRSGLRGQHRRLPFIPVEPELMVVGTGEGDREDQGGGHLTRSLASGDAVEGLIEEPTLTLADAWRSSP